jgi:hypothetical protein
MKLVNKVELKLENFEKCHMICDSDCPLGQLYDFSCTLKSFIYEKIKESEGVQPKVKTEEGNNV